VNVAVVDLGLGNLGSVLQAVRRAGGDPELVTEPSAVARAPRVILPGVAAFGLGMERAAPFRSALQQAISRRAPVLGICLGMQLLFEEGDEDGRRPGLGLLPGRVSRLPPGVQTPHIGWQRLQATGDSALRPSGWAYFAHSYRCEAPDAVTQAVAEHGPVRIPAVVGRGTLFGVQYHPEKSAQDGEALLRRFLELPGSAA
jgi:glutamine amidotransferase